MIMLFVSLDMEGVKGGTAGSSLRGFRRGARARCILIYFPNKKNMCISDKGVRKGGPQGPPSKGFYPDIVLGVV